MGYGHDELDRWTAFLNDRGRDGWELISVARDRLTPPPEVADGKELTEFTLFFKRPRN
jgi:hypothetical protein